MEFHYYHSINFFITFAWINSVINDTLEFPKLLWNKIKFSKTITFMCFYSFAISRKGSLKNIILLSFNQLGC